MTAILNRYSNHCNFLISGPISKKTCIKNGLLRTFLQDILTAYIAFPFNIDKKLNIRIWYEQHLSQFPIFHYPTSDSILLHVEQ